VQPYPAVWAGKEEGRRFINCWFTTNVKRFRRATYVSHACESRLTSTITDKHNTYSLSQSQCDLFESAALGTLKTKQCLFPSKFHLPIISLPLGCIDFWCRGSDWLTELQLGCGSHVQPLSISRASLVTAVHASQAISIGRRKLCLDWLRDWGIFEGRLRWRQCERK